MALREAYFDAFKQRLRNKEMMNNTSEIKVSKNYPLIIRLFSTLSKTKS